MLTIIAIASLTVFAIYKMNNLKSSTITSILSNTLKNLETEMNIPIKNTQSQIKIAQEWGNSGLINVNAKDSIISQFSPLLDQFDTIESISIVSSTGQATTIQKEKDWHISQYSPSKKGILQTLNADKKLISESTLPSSLDLRDTKWFKMAAESDESIFSYNVEDKDNIGTIAIHWENETSNHSGVIAFEISIGFISSIYKNMGQKGQAFLFDTSGKTLNISGYEDNITNNDMVEKTIQQWIDSSNYEFTVYPFRSGNTLWWTGVKPTIDNPGVMIAVISTEKNILPDLSSQRNRWYLIIAVIILVALILAFALYKSYSNSIDQINELKNASDVDDETKILALIQSGESAKLEFKSTIRMNLKSGKTGKEIEQAWLKNVVAFLNTDGGSLLLGVTDDGTICGLEADKFKSRDNCMLHITNLIKQHIGLEFNNYMDIECISFADKEIVAIHVKKSIEPAFLHMNKEDEEFYIRSGPSCTKLSISKALKYIDDQKSQTERA